MVATREITVPFAIDELGRVAFVTDPYAQISQHIQLLIGTRLNERFMLPQYGIDTLSYVFESLDEGTIQRMQVEIEHAISDWEPLVLVQGITITPNLDEATLSVSVDYSIQAPATSARADTVHTALIKVGGSVVETRG